MTITMPRRTPPSSGPRFAEHGYSMADPLTRPGECRAVQELLERVGRAPAALVLEGEAGIGKTTLWLRATEVAAAAGFHVLVARGAPTEVTFAYAAVADLIRTVDDSVLGILSARQRSAIDWLLVRDVDGREADERVVGSALAEILNRLAGESPVLLAIDDAHWLDTASQKVLGFVAPRLDRRVGLVLTVRPGDGTAPDPLSWLRLGHPEATVRRRVPPLSLGAIHALVAQRLGRTLPRPVMVRIHEISGGNPLFALELARAAAESGPDSSLKLPETLAGSVRDRLTHLPDETREVLLVAACAAHPTIELVAASTGRLVRDLVDLLEPAAAEGVAVIEGNRVSFTHPLLALGVITLATAPQRREVHRRLAALVEQAELRARHLAYAAVSPDEGTLAALDAAAGAAVARGAASTAAELIDLAIGLGGDTPGRRLRAADQHLRAGAVHAAQRHLDVITRTEIDSEVRCAAWILQSVLHCFGESLAAGVQAAARAVAEASAHPKLRLRALLQLAPALAIAGDRAGAVETAADAMRTAEQIANPALLSQAISMWLSLTFLNGTGVDDAALQTAVRSQDRGSTGFAGCRADGAAALLAAWAGRLVEGRAGMREVQRHCSERGSEADVIWAATRIAAIDVWLGCYQDAAEAADLALLHAEQINSPLMLAEALAAKAAVAAYTGDRDGARALARRALRHAADIGADFTIRYPLSTLAFVDVSCGDYAAAVATLEPLLECFDPDRDTDMVVGGFLPDAIEALVAVGRAAQAEPLVAALEANGARLGRRWMLAVGARGRAQLHAAAGDVDAAIAAASSALEHHRELSMPFETARTQLLCGQLQRRRRQRPAAAETLTDALATFEALGNALWAGRARDELDRLTAVSAEGLGLTPAESRIAQLAAVGLSNREIAAQLFLAPKTVEMNLSAVYRKLGIRSRAQLHGRLS